MKHYFAVLAMALLSVTAQAQIVKTLTESGEKSETVADEKEKKDVLGGNLSVTYNCWFDNFDKGYYGVRYESIDAKLMMTMAFKGSWGITDPGMYQWRVGAGPVWNIKSCKNLALVLPVAFFSGDYVKGASVKKGKVKVEKGTYYGGLVSPGVRFKAGGCVLGASFGLGFAYTKKMEFYKDFELSIGFSI